MKRTPAFFALLFLALAASRFCHLGVLWTEEGLPMAAAVQVLQGRPLYRGVWFDKPPLVSLVYLLWGAHAGWPLRLAGALFALLCCALVYRFARELWSEREGHFAAALMAFFLVFGIPAAVLPLAADLLMLAPHIAAVYHAWRGRPLLSGVWAGIAFLFNAKAVFVLAACALWQWRAAHWLLLGFAIPNLAELTRLRMENALGDYYRQVWQLGAVYARSTFLERPFLAGVTRTLNWAGFHAALVLGAAWFFLRDAKSDRARLAVWLGLSLAAVAAGWRFFPRYYFALLPAMTLAAARGLALMNARARIAVLLTLLVPLARFGPRYAMLARDLAAGRPAEWSDVAMDRDSRAAAARILLLARPGDTLFVWGYRPDLYVYTRMPAGTRFLDSQPLSGVFADRHLFDSRPAFADWARRNRQELVRTRPTFVVDGLSRYNPALAIENYPDLGAWLASYRLAARTEHTLIYRLISPSSTAHASQETP